MYNFRALFSVLKIFNRFVKGAMRPWSRQICLSTEVMKKYLYFPCGISLYSFSALLQIARNQFTFHTPTELAVLRDLTTARTPIGPGEWFLSSYSCRGCHGHDTTAQANIDENGNDVNLVSHWESSVMALASKDPLWRAKSEPGDSHQSSHEGPLQDKMHVVSCPSGRFSWQSNTTTGDIVNGAGQGELCELSRDWFPW